MAVPSRELIGKLIANGEFKQNRTGENINLGNDVVYDAIEELINEKLPLDELVVVKKMENVNADIVITDMLGADIYKRSRVEGSPTLEHSVASKDTFTMKFGDKFRYVNHIWEKTAITQLSDADVKSMIASTATAWADDALRSTLTKMTETYVRKTPATATNVKLEIKKGVIDLEKSTMVPRTNFNIILSQDCADRLSDFDLSLDFPSVWTKFATADGENAWGVKGVKVAPIGFLPSDVDYIIYIKNYFIYAYGLQDDFAIYSLNDLTGRPNSPRLFAEEVYEIDTYDAKSGVVYTKEAELISYEPIIRFTHRDITVQKDTAVTLDYLKTNNRLTAEVYAQDGSTMDITGKLVSTTIDTATLGIKEITVSVPAGTATEPYEAKSEVITVTVVA
jgi:hypothetical protein